MTNPTPPGRPLHHNAPTDTIYGITDLGELPGSLSHVIQAAQIRRRSHVPYLEQIQGPGSPAVIKLTATEMVVGRDESSAIVLRSTRISRHHALLKRRADDLCILDLDSQNGLQLNMVRIHSAVLREGDVLQLADFVFVYHED